MHAGHGFVLLLALAASFVASSSACGAETPLPASSSPPAAVQPAPAKQPGQFVERLFRDESGTHKYVVYLPPGYTKDRRWPVVLFLHGAGERGHDGLNPTYFGLGPVLRHSPELYPSVVVFPQCETWDDPVFTSWSMQTAAGRRALAILDEVVKTESIDPARQSLTGWSMGGFGSTAHAAHDPNRWQAVLAVAGGYSGTAFDTLQNAKLWVIHGVKDTIVSVKQSQQLKTELAQRNPAARFDEVASAGHEVWGRVYSDPQVAQWLLNGGPPPAVDWSVPGDAARLPTAADGPPFVPAATVSRAVTLRLGNDALQMISAGLPESVPQDRLQDALPDIRQSFTTDGETYDLALTQLKYVAQLHSVDLTTLATAELKANLGLKVEIQIGSASLKTKDFEAQTGPFRIVIGHRRPVILSVLIKPNIRNKKFSLDLHNSSFPISDDNWFVERPADIQLKGTKFTRYEMETGIVGGLYMRKADVEEQFRSVIPPLLERVEKRIDLSDSPQFTQWLWPFPVYQPRLRWTPEALSVDAQGMTVQLGATVASSSSTPGDTPLRQREGTSHLPEDSRGSTHLHVNIDPLLIDAVSEEFATSGVARINVLDLPESRFHAFAQFDRMRKVLPDLSPGTELQTVLALSSPFELRGEPESDGRSGVSHLKIPHAQLEVFTRTDAMSPWKPTAQFAIALDQQIRLSLEPRDVGPPLLGLTWSDQPDFQVSTSSTPDAQELSNLERDMREAWVSWTQTQNLAPAPATDFVLGDSLLRLDSLKLGPRAIDVDLKSPVTRFVVTGNSPLRYRIRQWNSLWGLPRTLHPGQTDVLQTTNPIEWQIIGVRGETYMLKPGEVARWSEETGIIYDPPRPSTAPADPAVGAK
ncbi:MAG: prolyl oligopeptidase family serine peptidase [Planctomycetaceae bacterium]